jgi:hypothetical protein
LLLPTGLAAFLTIAIAGSEAVTDPGGGPAAPVRQAAALVPGALVMQVSGRTCRLTARPKLPAASAFHRR